LLFVDTSFWIALFQPTDGRHTTAVQAAKHVAGARLATSNAIVSETWTLLRRRAGHAKAWAWLDRVRADAHCRIERVTLEVEEEAWSWLRVHDERPCSFVDATSFALMRRLRIREALAFDSDFAAAGFVEHRP
jgi:predicted nucleic acid-binding protein